MATSSQKRSEKNGGITVALDPRLATHGGSGLTFAVLYYGAQIGHAKFVAVDHLPRLAHFEHTGPFTHERIDHGQLEPLAAAEISRLQRDDGAERMLIQLAGFVDVPSSGAGRRGRTRDSRAAIAVEARRALGIRGLSNEQQKALGRARDAGLLERKKWTPNGADLLARIDTAGSRLMGLLSSSSPLTLSNYLPHVEEFGIDQVNAAIQELQRDRKITTTPANRATRARTGSRYGSIELRTQSD